MNAIERSIEGPWYLHFWPWFIVVLLGLTVVSGVWTVVIAFCGADSLVVDDYYREGRAINQSFAADHEARLREARAEIRVGGRISAALEILGAPPDALQLELSHITREDRDLRFLLERSPSGEYASAAELPVGHFYATLRPAGDSLAWRLRRRIELPDDSAFVMEPGE